MILHRGRVPIDERAEVVFKGGELPAGCEHQGRYLTVDFETVARRMRETRSAVAPTYERILRERRPGTAWEAALDLTPSGRATAHSSQGLTRANQSDTGTDERTWASAKTASRGADHRSAYRRTRRHGRPARTARSVGRNPMRQPQSRKKAASLPDHLAVGLVNWTNREPALAVPGMFHHREPATVPQSGSTFKTFQSTAKRSNQRAAIWTSTASIHPFDTQHKTALSSRQDRPGPASSLPARRRLTGIWSQRPSCSQRSAMTGHLAGQSGTPPARSPTALTERPSRGRGRSVPELGLFFFARSTHFAPHKGRLESRRLHRFAPDKGSLESQPLHRFHRTSRSPDKSAPSAVDGA